MKLVAGRGIKRRTGRSATSKLACEKGHAGGAVAYIEPAQYFDIKVVWIQGKELLSFTLSFSCLCAIVFVVFDFRCCGVLLCEEFTSKKKGSFFYLKHQTFFFPPKLFHLEKYNISIWKSICRKKTKVRSEQLEKKKEEAIFSWKAIRRALKDEADDAEE